jgi:hypothetical protein
VERALQVLERAKPEQIGDAETEVLRRMLPFLEAVFRHLSVDLPVNAILQALKKRQK